MSLVSETRLPNEVPQEVSLWEATKVWARIGCLNFGGPAGQIALMHRELVEHRRWIGEQRFLHALNYCMLLPGPEAQQLAIYIGWLMHRTLGGIVAGVLFVLPGAAIVLALSALYVRFQEVPHVTALFNGIKAAVLAIVIDAILRIGRRALKTPFAVGLAIAAFLALFLFDVAFPVVIGGAALLGAANFLRDGRSADASHDAGESKGLVDRMLESGRAEHIRASISRTVVTALAGLTLWIAPLIVLAAWLGAESTFVRQGVFFSQTAMVTFGGAYAVLSYVAQRAVEDFQWLRAGEMIDGLSLAETTPGPLILVLQFVAYVGAFRHATEFSPGVSGLLGAAVMLWTTFVPCFFWILVGAPYMERLRTVSVLSGALSAVTAAVVGVIANLSIWFALHTLFAEVESVRFGALTLSLPNLATINWALVSLAALAATMLIRFRVSIPLLLAGCGVVGLVFGL